MSRIDGTFLKWWHTKLGLARQSGRSWYCARLLEEIREVRQANTVTERPREISDVFFALSGAHHDGIPIGEVIPLIARRNLVVYAYMIGKYTMRWSFHRTIAWMCKGDWKEMLEVVNPDKDSKLKVVAELHGIDPEEFKLVAHRLLQMWPLLP
ncbi:hypothetical protein GQ43DRAFT_371653 [Delitschia confertaspora ATCC 74209]|uniref:Uncharacterized protein n=1 Tax=Delitschia confertaspora ATCC 74209 TaxID=1513339 RepID=A0A9P4JNB4_9PLEO|nr:hypothetical protein GQ43DRAFT_371653 [Delitschia confertaspora ATCC 74209]